jgi:hypothetical protein
LQFHTNWKLLLHLKEIKLRRQDCWGGGGAITAAIYYRRPAISQSPLLVRAGLLRWPYSHVSGARRSCVLAVVVGEWAFLAGHRLGFSVAYRSSTLSLLAPANLSVVFLDAGLLE